MGHSKPCCHHTEVLKQEAVREVEETRGSGNSGGVPEGGDRAVGRVTKFQIIFSAV